MWGYLTTAMRSVTIVAILSLAGLGLAFQGSGTNQTLMAQSSHQSHMAQNNGVQATPVAQEKDKTVCDSSGRTKGANTKCSCNRPCDPTTKKPQRDLRDGKPHCDNDCKEDLCHCPTQCDKGT